MTVHDAARAVIAFECGCGEEWERPFPAHSRGAFSVAGEPDVIWLDGLRCHKGPDGILVIEAAGCRRCGLTAPVAHVRELEVTG
jgi:hypothetical protein